MGRKCCWEQTEGFQPSGSLNGAGAFQPASQPAVNDELAREIGGLVSGSEVWGNAVWFVLGKILVQDRVVDL